MRSAVGFLSGLLLLSPAAFAGGNSAIIERYVEAFNKHNVEGMLDLAAEDVAWMSVADGRLSVATSTRDQLHDAMTDYFRNTPGARTEILSITESGPFVHTVEEAYWTSEGSEKSRCSMAIYELVGREVKNVWYFPSHDCA